MKVFKNGDMVSMTYNEICKDLEINPDVQPIEIGEDGNISATLSTPSEINWIMDAVDEKGYNWQLRDIAKEYDVEYGYQDTFFSIDEDDTRVVEIKKLTWEQFEAEEPEAADEIKSAVRNDSYFESNVDEYDILVCILWDRTDYRYLYVPYIWRD